MAWQSSHLRHAASNNASRGIERAGGDLPSRTAALQWEGYYDSAIARTADGWEFQVIPLGSDEELGGQHYVATAISPDNHETFTASGYDKQDLIAQLEQYASTVTARRRTAANKRRHAQGDDIYYSPQTQTPTDTGAGNPATIKVDNAEDSNDPAFENAMDDVKTGSVDDWDDDVLLIYPGYTGFADEDGYWSITDDEGDIREDGQAGSVDEAKQKCEELLRNVYAGRRTANLPDSAPAEFGPADDHINRWQEWCRSNGIPLDLTNAEFYSDIHSLSDWDRFRLTDFVDGSGTIWLPAKTGRLRTAMSMFDTVAEPRHRVAGWAWNDGLLGYVAEGSSPHFACVCGNNVESPGYVVCACGKIWNSYTVAGANVEGGVKMVCREVPDRGASVLLANRRP